MPSNPVDLQIISCINHIFMASNVTLFKFLLWGEYYPNSFKNNTKKKLSFYFN